MCVRWWTGSCRRLIGAVRGDHSPTRRCMRKCMVASDAISAWRSTIKYQTNALRKSKPGCRRSGVGYAAVPCRNREASSRREREEMSRSRGHYRLIGLSVKKLKAYPKARPILEQAKQEFYLRAK